MPGQFGAKGLGDQFMLAVACGDHPLIRAGPKRREIIVCGASARPWWNKIKHPGQYISGGLFLSQPGGNRGKCKIGVFGDRDTAQRFNCGLCAAKGGYGLQIMHEGGSRLGQ
jgi:hypothetical protein